MNALSRKASGLLVRYLIECGFPVNPATKNPKKVKDPELVGLGNRLRELRHAKGLSQESLADAADLHWSYVGQTERAERNITYKSILKLAQGLEVDPAELIKGLKHIR